MRAIVRKVRRGRVCLNRREYWPLGESLPENTEIEIRYVDPARVIGILPDGSMRELVPVSFVSPGDRQKVIEMIRQYREIWARSIEEYLRAMKEVMRILQKRREVDNDGQREVAAN
jgi:hypothetical protein